MVLTYSTDLYYFKFPGDYGKLGHGNTSSQKYPKLVQGPLNGKVRGFPLYNLNTTSIMPIKLVGLFMYR